MRENNLARDNGAEEEADGEGDEDEVAAAAAAEEADQGKRRMKLHGSERSRKSTNLATGGGDTTRRWERQALVHRRKNCCF